MRRRDFLSVVAGATVWPFAARAEQPGTPVIGFFTFQPISASQSMMDGFRLGLTQGGYTEGKNVRIEYRDANFKPELMLPVARELVRLKVDVIVAPGGPALVGAAREATSSIPIVAHDLESDPLAKGWVKSLAQPGGNMTGFFLDIPEMSGKQLALLRELMPQLSRLAVIGVPDLNAVQFASTESATKAAGIETDSSGGDMLTQSRCLLTSWWRRRSVSVTRRCGRCSARRRLKRKHYVHQVTTRPDSPQEQAMAVLPHRWRRTSKPPLRPWGPSLAAISRLDPPPSTSRRRSKPRARA
jgi:hypothetical protein